MRVNRLKTQKEFWSFLIKLAYILLALPFLLFVGSVLLLTMPPPHSSRVEENVIAVIIVWSAILIPVGIFFYRVFRKNSFLTKVVKSLQSPDHFLPDSIHEMYHQGDCKYLGIDIRNGTILYVHQIRKGQADVIGLNMGDWTNREVEGKMLRLYTKFPELPRIEISTPWAQRFYDTLGAMEYKRFDNSTPFSAYVNSHIAQLERDHKVHVPKLA